jgi:hypothetical protein
MQGGLLLRVCRQSLLSLEQIVNLGWPDQHDILFLGTKINRYEPESEHDNSMSVTT